MHAPARQPWRSRRCGRAMNRSRNERIADRRRRPRRHRAQEPLAGAPGPRAERHRARPRAVHVGPHVLRVVDPARQGRDVDGHQVLRGLLLLRHGRTRASCRSWSPAIIALIVVHALPRGAQVPDQLPAVRDVPRPHEDDEARGHDAVVVAGRHRLRAVLPRLASHLYLMLTQPGPHRPVRVRRPRVERPLVAALPGAAASPSSCTAASACTGWRSSGAGSRARDPNATRARLKTLKWAITVFFLVLGLRHARGLHEDRHRARDRRPASATRPRWRAARRRTAGADDEDHLHRRARHRRRARRACALAIGAQAPRPRRDHPVAGAAQALALGKAAQGGMQASLGNVIKGQGDNEDVHFEDTVRGSDWGADQEVVRMFVNTAPKAVRELAAWGVPWSRVRKGDRAGHHQRPEGHDHRARRGARPGRAARLRRHQEVAHLLRVRRHRPRDAVRGERPGDRRVDSRCTSASRRSR